MRCRKETSEIVEKTIAEIRESEILNDIVVAETCLKYNISERHIRRVACWKEKQKS